MPLGPFDWTGEPFLILYGALFVIATLVSFVAPALLRPDGRGAITTDPDHLALLAGGRERLFSAAATRHLAAGTLRLHGKRFAIVADASDAPPLRGEGDWKALARSLDTHADRIEAHLRHAGLLVDAATFAAMRRWAAWPYMALLLFGAIRWAIGVGRERPVEYLFVFMVVTALIAARRHVGLDRRTVAGRTAVGRARVSYERLRRAPTRGEMGLGVALFGTAVLAGSEFGDLHTLRAGNRGGGDGGGGDSSDGDGGCGGGGCGGCGGGD